MTGALRTAAVLVAAALAACEPEPDGPVQLGEADVSETVDDERLLERLANLPATSPWPDDWFQPRDVVSGVAEPAGLPGGCPTTVDGGIREAADYSRAQNGKAFVVWQDNAVVCADFATGFSPTQAFNSYHMHWLPLVLATMAAVDDGHIAGVDVAVSKYLPEWRDDPRGDIAIRDLLSMSAGLELYIDSTQLENRATWLFFGSDRAGTVLDWPLAGNPGEQYEYNYAVPEVLGLVLERATDRRYADYLSDAIWRPLGNSDAEVWLDRPDGRAYQNAALFADTRDWLNLGRLLAGKGRFGGNQVISDDAFGQIIEPSAANRNFGFLALGSPHLEERRLSDRVNYYSLVSEPLLVDDVVIVDGYVHRLFAVPSLSLVVLHVGQPGRVSGEQRARWDDAALLNPVLESLIERGG